MISCVHKLLSLWFASSRFVDFLKYNSYDIKSTHLKCTTQWFLVYSHDGTNITTI